MFYTYAHFRPDKSVFYIGKGHGRRAWSDKNRNPHWHHVIKKHGEHEVEVLAHWPTEQEAFDHEKFLIWCFRDMGYSMANIADGGEGSSGYKHRDETIQKMQKDRVGEKNQFFGCNHSKETKNQISRTKKANSSKPWLGKPRSEETKKKIAQSLLGRSGTKHTEESKRKISLAHMGKKQASPNEETRRKLSEAIKASWILRRQKVRKEV